MTLKPGVYRVRCKNCGAEGDLRIDSIARNGTAKTRESISHDESCPLYLKDQPEHLRKKWWRGQEKRANRLVGAFATPASGAVGMDGDGRSLHAWRVEAKQTRKDVFPIQQSVWSKLIEGAMLAGEEPVLHVEIRSRGIERFVAVRKEFYDALSTETPRDVPRLRYKTSFRIDPKEPTPVLISLDPPGVLLREFEFERIKEKK